MKLIILSLTVLITTLLLTGCKMNHSIIEEMDAAYSTASNQKNSVFEQKVAASSLVVQKYFPIGMHKVEALKLLNELYEQGFEITEMKHEGVKIWPSTAFRTPSTEEARIAHEGLYPEGITGYVAKKKFFNLLIFTKSVAMTINFDSNDTVIRSTGRINTDSI